MASRREICGEGNGAFVVAATNETTNQILPERDPMGHLALIDVTCATHELNDHIGREQTVEAVSPGSLDPLNSLVRHVCADKIPNLVSPVLSESRRKHRHRYSPWSAFRIDLQCVLHGLKDRHHDRGAQASVSGPRQQVIE